MSLSKYIQEVNEAGSRGDLEAVKRIVNEVKLVLLTSVDPIPDQYDFFENCICIAITKMQSEISNTIQLYKTFCVDDPNTERQLLVKSLNLLYLLISNNLPTFHAELELLTEEELQSPLIQFSVNIEGYLTTGRYNMIQECMHHLPNPIFSHLMTSLLQSIRTDIESCIEVSYREISVNEFVKTIGWTDSLPTLFELIRSQHPSWVIEEDKIVFPRKMMETQEFTKNTLGDLIRQVSDIQTI
ncbi:hypothetical protein WA588_001308, partial [Blastocystis sp. NMH]